MSEPQFLSLPKFLRQAQDLGLDVSERTLNYYIARGLLPKPIKKPFVGADGRVAYLPAEALKHLRKILKLKEEGLKLEQIRRTMEGKGTALADPQQKDHWQRELVYRYLRHLPAGHYKPARLQLTTRLSGSEKKLQVEDLKTFQIATLSPLVGEVEAQRWVQQFYLQLPERELQKHLHQVRREHLHRGEDSESAEVAQRVRQVVVDHLLHRISRQQLQDFLEPLRQRLRQAQRELVADSRGFVTSGLKAALDSLQSLGNPMKNQVQGDFQRLQSGFELLKLARQIAALESQAETWLESLTPEPTAGE